MQFATLSKLMNYYVLCICLTTYDIKKSGGLIFEKRIPLRFGYTHDPEMELNFAE